jgi:hypothetical protein
MCYRCSVCDGVRGHKLPQLRHTFHRDDGSIAAERPICAACQTLIASDIAYALLSMRHRRQRSEPKQQLQPEVRQTKVGAPNYQPKVVGVPVKAAYNGRHPNTR